MKINKLLTIIIACAIGGSVYAAPKVQWATALNNSKTNPLITTKINSPIANNSYEEVSFSYKLAADKELTLDPEPFIENSRQFWLDSTGKELAKGIKLPVTGGDTVIRISPLTNDKSVQITAGIIEIQNNGVDTGIEVFADNQQLKSTGVPFSDNSIALKVPTQAGSLNLKVNTSTGNMPFVIHVLEKDSPYVLSLNANQVTYNANQAISIEATMLAADTSINTSLQGYIRRPDGSVLGDLSFTQGENGSYTANIDAIGAQGLAQGLWEVHVFAEGSDSGAEFMRDAQTSFAVNLKTAEFTDNLRMSSDNLQVGINVGLEGRYEVRGVLMGTNGTGELQPIAMTMSANWLEAGQSSISLPLDAKIIAESGLSAPFAIKNLQLINQTYLAPVQTIKDGINILIRPDFIGEPKPPEMDL